MTFLIISLIGGCIALSALFSGVETGVISINRIRLRQMREVGLKGAGMIEKLLEDPSRLMVTILVGNNIVLVIASSLTTSLFEAQYIPATFTLAFLLLIFGEITPKIIFYRHSIPLVPLLAGPINIFYRLLLPVANLSTRLSSLFIKEEGGVPFMGRRELRLVMEEGKMEGVVDEDEFQMLDAALELPTTRVKEIMTPRVDMVCIRADASLDEILRLQKRCRHSRIPVYKESVDKVVGILYMKDLLRLWGNSDRYMVAEEFAHTPYFVPETMPLPRLFHEFQFRGVHMVIVVDEYGGVAGLVTMEDLLEEIVGEIRDEYDIEEESPYKVVDEGVYIARGKTHITLLNEDLGLGLKEDVFETISGLILDRLGRIPLSGEVVRFDGVKITILSADEKSIKLLRIEKGSK